MNNVIDVNIITELLCELTKYSHGTPVPYTVDPDILCLTLPPGRRALYHNKKCYVGSAEQSFLQMIKDQSKNFIPGEIYHAITPCHRDEDYLDETHFNIFLKVELFCLGDDSFINHLLSLSGLLYGLVIDHDKLAVQHTSEGKDLVYHDGEFILELGSYGYREVTINGELIQYCYGTAFAEPRLSYIRNRSKT